MFKEWLRKLTGRWVSVSSEPFIHKVSLRYVPDKLHWELWKTVDKYEVFIQEFGCCENIDRIFMGRTIENRSILDKKEDHLFVLTIQRIGKRNRKV